MDAQPSSNPKQQLIDRLKAANNVLVTVSANPSVDQLAACIGLTLVLNKAGKHATAVFSGEVPSTLEFLEPETTLEKNTDSLRDFIIALDKSKADKLRYKVEDKVVKIFITPYRTSLSVDDLEFSQGDFNIDVVVTLGVQKQEDLDAAITAHGRILHDATLTSINLTNDAGLGTINWSDTQASSLCELVVDLSKQLGDNLVDAQVATALLTGVVAETERFSNEKTTPQTMSVSAELMSKGANQQLVASKLEGPSVELRQKDKAPDTVAETKDSADKPDDGTLEIGHPKAKENEKTGQGKHGKKQESPKQAPVEEAGEPRDIFAGTEEEEKASHLVNDDKASKRVTEAPSLGGTLTANTEPEEYGPSTDPLTLPKVEDQLLSHDAPLAAPAPLPATDSLPEPSAPATDPVPPPAFNWTPPSFVADNQALAPSEPAAPEPAPVSDQPAIELPVAEPADVPPESHVDAAREEVEKALSSVPSVPEPVQALNAQPIDLQPPVEPELVPPPAQADTTFDPTAFGITNEPAAPATSTPDFSSPMGQSLVMPLPPAAPPAASPAQSAPADPNAPPPVPPPLPFQFNAPSAPPQEQPKQ